MLFMHSIICSWDCFVLSHYLDLDECTLNPRSCHQYANCSNTQGSFTCTCHVGYSGNGTYCEGEESKLEISFYSVEIFKQQDISV